MNRVLIITYYWPPSGGAGVQRWLKFAKYLPQSGWEPVILTVDPGICLLTRHWILPLKRTSPKIPVFTGQKQLTGSGFTKETNQKSHQAALPQIRMIHSKEKYHASSEAIFLFLIRAGAGTSYAFKKACELIEKEDIKYIITTSPPHSTQLIGLRLKKHFPEIKWMADLRDPWTDIYYYDLFYPSFISRKIDLGYEKAVLEHADIITTVGPSLGKYFESKVPDAAEKIKIVHNGYDESDFENLIVSTPAKFTISYTGTISESYPVEGFIKAIAEVIEKGQ